MHINLPPPPPQCAAAPPTFPAAGAPGAAAAPSGFANTKPHDAFGDEVALPDGGKAWKLGDGGWAFQYEHMAIRVDKMGTARMEWKDPAYKIHYDDSSVTYHAGDEVVHQDEAGVIIHNPSGTVHAEGNVIIYHWCEPSMIVYETPAGTIYHDATGLSYQGRSGTIHYSQGEVLYQGIGGISQQKPDGSVTHWTPSGAIFRHPDGTLFYTPTGETEAHALSPGELGPDPFPGPPLSVDELMRMTDPKAAPAPAPAKN